MKAISRILLVKMVTVGMVFLISGCGEGFREFIEYFAKNCEINPDYRIGEDRKVIFLIRHHIYVSGESGKYDPNGKTKHPYGYRKNSTIVNKRDDQIYKLMNDLNKIYEKEGVNIRFLQSGGGVHVDSEMATNADLTNRGIVDYTGQVAYAIKNNDPSVIHVFWCWGSKGPLAAGINAMVCIGDDPWFGDEISSYQFAHEIFHALGYERHHPDLNNLMAQPAGKKLEKDQIKEVWGYLNTSSYRDLWVLSCKSDS